MDKSEVKHGGQTASCQVNLEMMKEQVQIIKVLAKSTGQQTLEPQSVFLSLTLRAPL